MGLKDANPLAYKLLLAIYAARHLIRESCPNFDEQNYPPLHPVRQAMQILGGASEDGEAASLEADKVKESPHA